MANPGRRLACDVFGVVDGFDCAKHFGFIRFEGRTIYTNRRDITDSGVDDRGRRYLLRDQVVLFDLYEGPRGLMACNVRVKAEIPQSASDVQILEKGVPGQIVSVKAEKKFCIIRTNCSEFETLLGHFSNFKRTPQPAPQVGTSVLCDVAKNSAGKHVAQRIRVQATKPAAGLPDASDLAGLQLIEKGVEGRVVSVKKERGFAIIETEAFGTLLCHYTKLKASEGGLANLQVRQKVVCDVAENRQKKKKVAINVQPGEVPDPDPADELEALHLGAASEPNKEINAIEDELMCFICFCVLENPVTFPCEHLFCWECIYKWLEFQHTCPVDRKRITMKDMKPAPRYVKNMLEKLGSPQ